MKIFSGIARVNVLSAVKGKITKKRLFFGLLFIVIVVVATVATLTILHPTKKVTESATVAATRQRLPELQKQVDADPNNAGARYNLGSAYYVVGDKEKAAQEYETAISKDAGNAIYHNNLANTYRDLKKYDKAVAEYKKAIELDAKQPNAYMNLAQVQSVLLHDDSAALATYNAAVAATEGSVKTGYLLSKAALLEKMSRRAEAHSIYQQILTADPDNATAKAGVERTK